MARRNQSTIHLLPASTIDTEADPKQARGPLELKNCFVTRVGEIRRRPGLSAYTRAAANSTQTTTSLTSSTIFAGHSLFDRNGTPGMVGRVYNDYSATYDDYVDTHILAYDSTAAKWRVVGNKLPFNYSVEAMQAPDTGRVVSAAEIGNIRCYVVQPAALTSATIHFVDMTSGAEIVAAASMTSINSWCHVVAGGAVFYVVAPHSGASNKWNVAIYSIAGASVAAATPTMGVAAATVRREWALIPPSTVGGTDSRIALTCGDTTSGDIYGLTYTEAGGVGFASTLLRNVPNLTQMCAWATMQGTRKLFIGAINTGLDVTASRHTITNGTNEGTSALATIAAGFSVGQMFGGGWYYGVVASEGAAYSYIALSGTKNDAYSTAHAITYFASLGDGSGDKAATVGHVTVYGKPTVFSDPDDFKRAGSAYTMFPAYTENLSTRSYFLMSVTPGFNNFEARVIKLLTGAAGLGTEAITPPYPLLGFSQASEFKFLFDKRDRAIQSYTGDPSQSTTAGNPFIATFTPGSNNAIAYANGLGTVFDGGAPGKLTDTHTAIGFLMQPELPVLTESGSGKKVSVHYIYEELDAVGDKYQSVASDEAQKLDIATLDTVAMATYYPETVFRLTSIRQVVFQTIPNATIGTIHYRSTVDTKNNRANGLSIQQSTGFLTDPNLITEELLQDVGTLDAIPPPGLSSLMLHGNRLYGISMDDSNEIWYTTKKAYGVGWRFNDTSTVRIVEGGPCVALASLDDHRVVFKSDSIYSFGGDGPDSLGVGAFTEPTRLSADVGVRDIHSVVSTADGIYFKSKAGIYLLSRSGVPEWIGKPVKVYDDDVCIRAVHMPELKQIRFIHETTNDILVWDYHNKVWSRIETNLATAGDIVDACNVGDVFHLLTNIGAVLKEDDETTYGDDEALTGADQVVEEMKYGSQWVHLEGLQGFQRVKWIHLLGEMPLAYDAGGGLIPNVYVNIYYDYEDAPGQVILLQHDPIIVVPNTGFETGGDWTLTGTTMTIVGGTGQARTGTGVLRKVATGTGTATQSTPTRVPKTGTIHAGVWTKRVGGSATATLAAVWYDGEHNVISTTTIATSGAIGTSYALMSGTAAAPSNAVFVALKITLVSASSAVVYADDVNTTYWTSTRSTWEHRIKPKRQKCKAIRVEITTDVEVDEFLVPADFRLSQVSLIVDNKPGKLNRLGKE